MTELTEEKAEAAKAYASEEVERLLSEKNAAIQAKVDEAYTRGYAAAEGARSSAPDWAPNSLERIM